MMVPLMIPQDLWHFDGKEESEEVLKDAMKEQGAAL